MSGDEDQTTGLSIDEIEAHIARSQRKHVVRTLFATLLLLACSVALVVFAQPLLEYAQASAAQLNDLQLYRAIVKESGT